MNDKSVALIVPGGADDEVRHILIDGKDDGRGSAGERENRTAINFLWDPGRPFWRTATCLS